MRAIKTLGRGLALNLLAILPAIPIIRHYLYLPSADWWLSHNPSHLFITKIIESLVALALIDLSMTLVHIWWHGPLARLHATRIHHTIPEDKVDWTTGQEFGPWEPLMGVPTVWAIIIALGTPLGPAIFATTTMLVFSLWSHTNWWPRWYKHLEWVFITPVSHRVHHSPDPELYDRNCAFVFNWDRLLGTYRRNPIWE